MLAKNLTAIADLEIDPVKSLWNGRIPIGGLTLLEGYQSAGKTTIMAHLTAAITAGRELPEMEAGEIANVVWLCGDDHLSLLSDRLIAAGADLTRVFSTGRSFIFGDRELPWLSNQLEKISPVLVVIDSISSYLSADPNRHENVRLLVNALRNIALEFDCAIVMIRDIGHLRMGGKGSGELAAAARSVLRAGYMAEDDEQNDDNASLALTQTKNNFGRMAERLLYKTERDLDSPGGVTLLWKETEYVQV